MARQSVWIVGDWRNIDFAPPLMWLQERAACRRFDDADKALAAQRGQTPGAPPAAILLVQSRPGQIATADVERMHRHAPLARLVGLMGPWCEGEQRSGRPWPGVARVPWRSWSSRLASELGLDHCGEQPAPPLPRTASDAERLERSLLGLRGRGGPPLVAAVCAESRVRYESLRDSLTLLGIRSTWHWPGVPLDRQGVDFVVADGWDAWPATALPLEPPGRRDPPHILLLDFPRPDDAPRARALGAAAIVAQPLLLADLAWALDAVLPIASPRQQTVAT